MTNKTKSKSAKLMSMKYFMVLLFFCIHIQVFGQKIYSTIKEISNVDEIVFYGYDFSNFTLVDPRKLNNERVKEYLPAWVDFLNQKVNEDYLASKLRKKRVVFDFEYTTKVIRDLNPLDMVTLYRKEIHKDSIQSIIHSYHMNHKEGIGLSVIVECFDKHKDEASAYFTFFDIATKAVISTDCITVADPSGIGLTSHWGSALTTAFKYYLKHTYKKRLKVK